MDGGMETSSNHVLYLGMFWKSYDVLLFLIFVTMIFQMYLLCFALLNQGY